MAFRVGQKVVCVSARWAKEQRDECASAGITLPEHGIIYTVRAVEIIFSGEVHLMFEEIVNPIIAYREPTVGIREQAFASDLFRPLAERKTDLGMSMLRSILNAQPDQVDA